MKVILSNYFPIDESEIDDILLQTEKNKQQPPVSGFEKILEKIESLDNE